MRHSSKRIAGRLTYNLSFRDRAAFVTFARAATIGHWAEVIDTMEGELIREGRDPRTGELVPPPCAAAMGCLCAFHARGGAPDQPCNATE